MLHIAVNADCAGPSGFSFALMITVSGESCCIPRIRRFTGCAGAAACCIAAKAGKEVVAAEAAPRRRINDLRETPCVISEFIRVLLESPVSRYAAPRRQFGARQLR